MFHFPACDEGPGVCSRLLTVFSLFLIIVSLPLSLFVVVKVVQVILVEIVISVEIVILIAIVIIMANIIVKDGFPYAFHHILADLRE